MLSVIIPSYKDPFLHKTIDSIIDNFTGDFEVIPVFDGYKPEDPLRDDERIKPIFLKERQGMRKGINAGVRAASGKYIMRTDEHCMFARGFDATILETIKDNWIVVPRRFFLDPYKWEVMDKKPVDYERLIIKESPRKFSARKWKGRDKKRKGFDIDRTMAMQGSCWIMHRAWWNSTIKELQSEGYGILYQDSIEMLFKTWKAGGDLMLNKLTWYAHKHRSFNRTHNYPNRLARASFKYALDTWEGFYNQEIKQHWEIKDNG